MRSWRPSPMRSMPSWALHLERDAPAVDARAFGIDRHRLAGHRRGDMRHVDVDAEAALALVEMRLQHLEARPFHQADHEAGGEHGRHLAELGRLRIKVRHGLLGREAKGELRCRARFQRVLHGIVALCLGRPVFEVMPCCHVMHALAEPLAGIGGGKARYGEQGKHQQAERKQIGHAVGDDRQQQRPGRPARRHGRHPAPRPHRARGAEQQGGEQHQRKGELPIDGIVPGFAPSPSKRTRSQLRTPATTATAKARCRKPCAPCWAPSPRRHALPAGPLAFSSPGST